MSDGIPTEVVKLHLTCHGDKILQRCDVSTLEQSRTVHYFVDVKSVLGLSTSRSNSRLSRSVRYANCSKNALNSELFDSVQFNSEWKYEKLAVVVHVPQGT